LSCARRLVVSDAPILLLCIARPELLDRRPGCAGGKLNATTVLLEPLTHVGELCARIDEAVVRLLVEPEGAIGRLEVLLEQAMPLFESAGNDFALYNAPRARVRVTTRCHMDLQLEQKTGWCSVQIRRPRRLRIRKDALGRLLR
jgi:hypothetical protein